MERLKTSEARNEFSDVINRVAFGKSRIVLHRRGKDVAALVTMDDLALLEAIEDIVDLEDAREALKEPGTVPWEKLKKELGME